MIYLLGKGATSGPGKSLFRAASAWWRWRCAQYFVIASCGRDNRCMYMAHVCFLSVVVIVCGNVCCVAGVVEDFFLVNVGRVWKRHTPEPVS